MTRSPEAAFRILRRDGSTRFVTGESRTIPELSLLQLRMVEQKEKEWNLKSSCLTCEVAQVLLDENLNGIKIIAGDGKLVYANQAAAQHLGMEVLEIGVKDARTGSEEVPLFKDQNEKALSKEELPRYQAAESLSIQGPRLLQCWLPKADAPRWFIVKAIPKSTDSVGLEYVIEITQDVTSLMHAEKSHSEFESYINASPDLILVVENKCIIKTNCSLQKLLGFKQEELKHKPILDLIHPDDRDGFEVGVKALQKGQVLSPSYFRFLTHQGEWVGLQVSAVPIARHTRILWVARNISEWKRSQRELLAAKSSAEASNRIKSRYLYKINQELRSPMTGVVSMAELLDLTALDDEQYCLLKTLRSSAKSIVETLSRLSEFTALAQEPIALKHETFEVRTLLQNAVAKISLWIEFKKVKICIESSTKILEAEGDPNRIEQVVLCLLSNAIKATESGEIVIRYRLEKDRLGWWLIRIEIDDSGMGTQALQKNSNLLWQKSETSFGTQFEDDSLIGWAQAKELVELWGGQIGSENRGQGTIRRWFTLPTSQQTSVRETDFSFQEQLQERFVPHPENKVEVALKICVCDDHALNREVVCKVLESLGHSVTLVSSGEELLRDLALGSWPDVILLDCQMPVMDGFEVARRIRQMEMKGKHQLIIALTADAVGETRKRCLDAGMDDYTTKPVIRFELQCTLMNNIRRLGLMPPLG